MLLDIRSLCYLLLSPVILTHPLCSLNLGTNIGGGNVDSARQNLASTFVNGFVNTAFGKDKLVTDGTKWLYKNKEHGR